MTFSAVVFYQISIIIYVGIWAYFKYRPYMLLRKNTRPSVYKIEELNTISSLVRRLGWFIVLFLPIPCTFLFPEVQIITQDYDRAKAESYHWYNESIPIRKTFFIDRYYVPFYYNGNHCKPGENYLSNETDSTLVLYLTHFYNGQFTKRTSKTPIKTIKPNSLILWNENIDNRFDEPNEYSYFYVPEKHKNKSAIEWTIDTKSGAVLGMKKVANEIKRRQELIKGIWKK